MNKILTPNEINQFKSDGAIYLKDKFDVSWIKKLQKGIERDIKSPSPRFKSHTVQKVCLHILKIIGLGISYLNSKNLFMILHMQKLLQN